MMQAAFEWFDSLPWQVLAAATWALMVLVMIGLYRFTAARNEEHDPILREVNRMLKERRRGNGA